MDKHDRRITIPEARRAICNSGYLIETRVERILDRYRYVVHPNYLYPDRNTGKSREIDILASRMADLADDNRDYVSIKLVIECINNPQPITFFAKSRKPYESSQYDIKFSGMPVKILGRVREREFYSIADALNLDNLMHICSQSYATQYCSYSLKKDQSNWFAFHDDIHFNCMEKLCEFSEYERQRYFTVVAKDAFRRIFLKLFYPVLIVQGELYEALTWTQGPIIRRSNHILFHKPIIYNNQTHDYFIDVIKESYLSTYLEIVSHEFDTMIERIKKKKKKFDKTVNYLLPIVKKLKSEKEIIEELAF